MRLAGLLLWHDYFIGTFSETPSRNSKEKLLLFIFWDNLASLEISESCIHYLPIISITILISVIDMRIFRSNYFLLDCTLHSRVNTASWKSFYWSKRALCRSLSFTHFNQSAFSQVCKGFGPLRLPVFIFGGMLIFTGSEKQKIFNYTLRLHTTLQTELWYNWKSQMNCQRGRSYE